LGNTQVKTRSLGTTRNHQKRDVLKTWERKALGGGEDLEDEKELLLKNWRGCLDRVQRRARGLSLKRNIGQKIFILEGRGRKGAYKEDKSRETSEFNRKAFGGRRPELGNGLLIRGHRGKNSRECCACIGRGEGRGRAVQRRDVTRKIRKGKRGPAALF